MMLMMMIPNVVETSRRSTDRTETRFRGCLNVLSVLFACCAVLTGCATQPARPWLHGQLQRLPSIEQHDDIMQLTVSDAAYFDGEPEAEQDLENSSELVPAPVAFEMPLGDLEFQGPYLINVGDEVELKFPYRPDFNERLTVGDDGMISPSLTEPVLAAGKPSEMLEAELRELLRLREYDPAANRERIDQTKYLISSGDEIEVRFTLHHELNDSVTVRTDGRISLARVRTVIAEGKSPQELEKELIERYSEFVPRPELVVIMRKTTSQSVYVNGVHKRVALKDIGEVSVVVTRKAPRLVYVTGEVGTPRVVTYQPRMTALRAIVSAGGAKRSANLSRVTIIRRQGAFGGTEMSVNLHSHNYLDGGYSDMPLLPNDIVVVPKTKIAKIQDFLDQHVYDLFPPTRNSAFNLIYNLGIPAAASVIP